MSDEEPRQITADDVHRAVADKLARGFDTVAKEAMRAAAAARDPSVEMVDKLDDAHIRVTLDHRSCDAWTRAGGTRGHRWRGTLSDPRCR